MSSIATMQGTCSQAHPKISVIVPVHNSESTLVRSIESIRGQDYPNIQVVLVVNACTDGSEAIARSQAALMEDAVVIVTATPGVSHARNLGIDASDGDYLGFVDADDWVESTMYSSLMSAMRGNEKEIACCGWVAEDEGDQFQSKVCSTKVDIAPDDYFHAVLMGPINGFSWNKLFSRRAVSDRRFDESLSILEDMLFCCSLADGDTSIRLVPQCPYHYVRSPGSVTNDLSKLVTTDREWSYLKGALLIRDRVASTRRQRELCGSVLTSFAAPGICALAGRPEYVDVYVKLRWFMVANLKDFLLCEPNKKVIIKTLISMVFPNLVGRFRRKRVSLSIT